MVYARISLLPLLFILFSYFFLVPAFNVDLNDRFFPERDVTLFVPSGWQNEGKPSPSDSLELLIGLRHRNIQNLQKVLNDVSIPSSPRYGRYLTLQQASNFIAPEDYAKPLVKYWLRMNGVDTIQITEIGNDWIKVQTDVQTAEKLLQVEFYEFSHQTVDLSFIRTLDHYSIPSALRPVVDIIGGVFRFPQIPNIVTDQGSRVLFSYTTPETIQQMYGITLPQNSSNNLQAVASFLNQYFSPTDLQQFQKANGLPQVPIQKVVGTNLANVPGVEASLDVQYLLGITNCSIDTWVISTSGTTPSKNEPFLDFLSNLSQLNPIPYLFSISYQDYEYTVSESYANRCNEEFMKYSVQGITFITGSGDWGVGCKDASHCSVFTADFPSSSPYVISTGATTLSSTNEEIGVSFSSGGFSNYFAMPSFQTTAVNQFLNQPNLPPASYYNASGRAFPDVAAIGTNFEVYYKGKPSPVGGTSASTPTFGSMLSMINSNRLSAGLPTLGYALPFLYEAWSTDSTSFNDITSSQAQDQGCCGHAFTTTTGWDPYTGLGTPNYSVLAQLAMSSTLFNFPK